MPRYTCDTSYVIAYPLTSIPDNFVLCDVVLLELMGQANDTSTFNKYKTYREISILDETLITPTVQDWFNATRVLFLLEQGVRRDNRGIASPKRVGATQRMALDALIAMSARRERVTVVTENVNDFLAIQYYYEGLRFMRGSEYNARFLVS